MENAKHIGRGAIFIVTGFCLIIFAGNAEAKTPETILPGLTLISASANFTKIALTTFSTTPVAVMKSSKSTPSLLDIFISPTPAILPKGATPVQDTTSGMFVQEITVGTVTPIPTQEVTPTPTTMPQATGQVTYTPANTSTRGGLNADILFQMVQDYRVKSGLPEFQKNDQVCSLAASRAPEVGAEITNGHMHSGLKARNLPYWNTENIISMRNEAEAFNWWINDPIHHDAIVSHNTYSCMACSGNSCAEEFTSLEPK